MITVDVGQRPIREVHEELKGILQPKCIPKVAGASWAGKIGCW